MRRGLTLIEIIIAIALAAVIVTLGITAMNPGAQLAQGRNTQRQLHLQGIMDYIRQNMADNSGGAFVCATGPVPTSSKRMASGPGNYDIAGCLLLSAMPFDPSTSGAHYLSNSDYDSGYDIVRNASTGQITVSAPSAELGKTISITR